MDHNIGKSAAAETEQQSSWLANSVSEAWSVSKAPAQDMRAQGSSRLAVAATTETVAALSAVAGTIEMGLGSIALPIDAVAKVLGTSTGRSTADDKAMIQDGAKGLVQSPVVAAFGIYSLLAPQEKQK